MAEVKIRLKDTVPFPLELALINNHGFRVVYRNKIDHFTEYAKKLAPATKKAAENIVVCPMDEVLSEEVQTELIKKVNKIVDFYGPSPETHTRQIRARLRNMAGCYEGTARKFILDWMEKYASDDQ